MEPTLKKGDRLTSSDPEPPVGTIVRCLGQRWQRVEQPSWGTYWIRVDDIEGGDPESWTKIAGNYGPVTIVAVL